MASALPAQVQEARRDVDASRARAEAAEREAALPARGPRARLAEHQSGGDDEPSTSSCSRAWSAWSARGSTRTPPARPR